MRVDMHVHTRYSMDSLITPKTLIKVARQWRLHGIAVTDHNTIRGGRETQKINSNQDLLVIVGSEIKTTTCEIIGLFLQ
jgi:predicted metal-dependent phosphoesterase TrpH